MHAVPDINTRTVNELFDRYEREGMSSLAARTSRDYQRHLVRLRQEFGSRKVGSVMRSDIEAFLRGSGSASLNNS